MKQYIIWSAAALAVLLLASNSAAAETTQDHYKDVYHKTPHTVEVCYDQQVSGDKTGDTLKGAILGGIIGNNVTKDLPDGGTAGAIIGGMLGHQNSDAKGGTRRVCREETRYTESQERVYSHSTISFLYNGKIHKVRFQK